MSLKPCTFKLTGVKGELSYDQMRKHLMENPDLWVGKKYSKVSPVKIVVNKFSKTIADKFDKLSKAMGFDTKLEFISEAEAREILRTDPANVKKMLAGPNSKRSKQVRDNYFVAVEMQNNGIDSEKIWQATGWEMMPDGKWRYEIPTDRLATAFESERESEGKNFQTYVANKVKDLLKKGTTLGQLFPNGSLLAAYPGFKDMKVLLDYTLTGAAGYYDYENKRIVLSSDLITGYFLDAHNIEQVLLHETQHAIQHKEGFARGGNLSSKDTAESQELFKVRDGFLNSNPDFKVKMVEHRDARQERQAAYDAYIANISDRKNVKRLKEAELRVSAIEKELVNDPLYKKLRDILLPIKNKYGAILPYDFYRNLLGEVESRNVSETRVFMSEEERRKTPPSKTSDIKPASATVFYIDEDDKRGYSQGSSAGFSTTRDGKPIGFQYDTEQVARERFDLSKFKKFGSGSDRDVFDLGNGKVLKIAKNGRGLEQNIYEGDFYLSEAGVIPEAFERGLNYVVVENVPRISTLDNVFVYDLETGEAVSSIDAGQMLHDLAQFTQKDFNNKVSKLQDVFRQYGLEAALDYDILYGDFTRKANWGYINGKAVHIDGGTFGGVDAIIGNKNKALNDAEFRDVYKKSQELKRKLQDTDKYTRYMRTPDGYVMGFVQRQDDGSYKVFIDPKVVNPETPIHEIAGHVFLPIVKETNPELYAKGVDLIKDSPYMDRVKQEYPELSEEEMYEEALAQAVGEKGALLKDQKKKGFVDWLKTFWQKTADVLGIKVSPEQLAEMDLNKFTDLIAGSILNAEDLIKIKQQTIVEEGQSTAKTEDPVGQLLTGSTQEQKEAAFDQIVGEAADTETEGRDEYEQERPQGKSFAESVKDDVRAYLKKGQDALTNYSDKAKAFIKNVSLRTKRVIAIAMLSGGLLSGAVNYVQANNDGYIPSISDITALGERALIKLGLVEIPENAGLVNVDEIIDKKPEKVVIRPDSGKATSEPVVFNILGKVTDWKQESQGFKLWMYQRDADNGHLVYVPGPHKRNFKAYGASGVANVEGVGHFLVSPQDLTHLTSNPLLKKLKEQFLAEIKYKTPDAWVPTFKKENNNLVRLTLKKLGDVKEEDIVVSQLHQTPFLDIDTNARLNPGQFNSSIHCLAKRSTGEKLEQYLMGPTKDNYNQCSGGSFFILAETPKGLKIREMSGPINLMLKDAYRFAKKNGVGMDKITIGVLDAGSYSAKPIANEKNVVKLDQYEQYNTQADIDLQGGAALMIPEGGGVEFRKAMELSENEENTPDNIAAIVNVMNTLPGAGIERNIYTITQQRGVLDTKKSKRKGIVKDVPVVSIDDFLGRPVLFTISDELTTGEITNPYTGQKIKNLKGGLYFNYSEGNTEHAWAFTEKSKADGLLKQAKELYRKHPEKYPDGIVPVAVVKMGVQAMESNEAIVRQLEQNIPSFPAENKAAALAALPADIQKQIDGLQEKIDLAKSNGEKPRTSDVSGLRGLKKALELTKTSKSFDDFVRKIKTLPIGARPLIIKRITTGEAGSPQSKLKNRKSGKPAVDALMEGLNPQEGLKLNIGNLVDNITEPSLKNVPDRHIISFVGVDATASGSLTTNTHPNYPATLKGKGLGVLKDTVHIASVSPAAYAATLNKMAEANNSNITASQSISNATGAGLATKYLRGESLVKDLSDFDKLVGALRLAFPSVQFFTDADSWANIMDNPDVKKYIKNGEVVYGLTKDGSIYLNPDAKDFNTPIHEAGHIWVDMLEQTNNDLLQQGFKLIEGTKALAAAIAEYGDNIQARKEALAVLIGNKGESIVNAAQKANFSKWLNAMFEYVQKTFKSLTKHPVNKLADITLNQFVEGAIADILGGKEVAGKVVATEEAQFRKSLPIKLRNAIQDLINEQKANPTKIYFYEVLAKARGLMQAAGLSEADIDAQVKAMEEREEAKTESEYFSDYVSKLKAAAKLTIPEARALMKQFRNFLNSEEDLADAMDFVDRLVKKKDLLDKVNKAKDAFKALKKLRNSKKLTAADQRFIANLAIPRFYLLDEATLIKLREMATNFVDSRVNQSPVKFEISEIDAAFNEASKVMPSKTRKAGVRKIARMTLAEMQFRTKQALQEYANEIPSAKELLGMDLSLLDKDALNLISNALKTYDETGVLFSIPAIVETVRALNDAKRIQKSGIIANIQKLAAGGIAGRLQSLAANADEIRRMLVGGWDRNAARVTIETQELRTQIDQAFSKLGISDTDKFTLGAYGFFKEETGGQTPEIKANVLAAQMNNLRDQIAAAKEMNSDSQEVAMLQHYYSGNTEALKALGVIRLENGQWVAADNINVDALAPDKVKKAWEYAQNILTSKTAAYTAAMAEYHGKDFDQIFQYYPRSFYKTDVSKADLQEAAEDLPPMGSIDPKTTKQDTDIAARNEGRTNTMPKRGGFYILDGYETLVNGVWDINATIELSKAYAYTNALINKANITNNADTNGQIKKYIVSSVKGILRDPMIFPDNRSGREKFGSAFFNIVTTTILNNFTQLFKQTMGVTAGFVTNPAATLQAMGLIMKGMGDKKTQEALDRFYKNTSEPYTLALSYIELDTLGRNKGPVMDKITGVFDKIKPEYLVNANRFTQRMLLLSGYLANTNPDKFVENSNNGVFNETALAAAENNAEMANSTANRHFLPLQLKDAGTMKKFLYFLGTYNFVTTSNFWSNAKILQGAGYTKRQKEIATKQMASLAVQQVMYQLMLRAVGEGLKAIGRDLDWLDEESEEQRKKRFMKYWYQVPASVVMDLTVGPMVSLFGDAFKSATIVASEVVYGIASEGATGDKLDLLFKRSNEYPGAFGVVAPLIEQMYKATKSKDQEFQIAVAVQATAMLMAWGDLYYLARIKAQTIQSILKVAGGDEVMKAFRDGNSPEYKNWVNTIRERNIPDKFIFKMSWQDDGIGYYVPASEMSKFVQVYNKEYLNEIHLLTMRNKYVPVKKRKSAEQLKKSAENAAALEAQKSIKNPHKFKMPAK